MRKLVAAGFTSLALLFPLVTFAQLGTGSTGLTETGDAATISTDLNVAEFIGGYVIRPALGLLGLLFLCLTVYAGFMWMTAQGNEKRVQKAKEILIAAVTGAVIVATAYAVTGALFNALSSGSITGTNPQSVQTEG